MLRPRTLPMKPILVDMAERVEVRRLSDEGGRRLQRLVRRGEPKAPTSVIRFRRAMAILALARGNRVPLIARLVAAGKDIVREMIHRFNKLSMGAPDPRWAGGRPRRIATCCSPWHCATTCAGATPTPHTLTSWPPSDANGPECGASVIAVGASPSTQPRRDHTAVIPQPGKPSWSGH